LSAGRRLLHNGGVSEKQTPGIGKGTPGPGRKKGVPNKQTTQLKEMILGALDMAGGVEYLYRQASENPGPFMSLIGKVLPTTLAGDAQNPLTQVHRIERVIIGPQPKD
jgi:hypothetical protein